ncbi:autotransporter domain-containing protein [uncultured Succinatimonas sp.]|uniref:autotransporter family protein n=1 Tax=uncultured Succinatimonas sp. TaxID=1262973 RepID=UPI0025DEF6BC|nr:autotransporter domain-containing protein [uncultured Succinatimonas sp.]
MSIDYDHGYQPGDVIVEGKGTVYGHGGGVGIGNYEGDLSSNILIKDTNFIVENFKTVLVYAEGGKTSFLNNEKIESKKTPYGFHAENDALIKLKEVQNVLMEEGSQFVEVLENSEASFENIKAITLRNVEKGFYSEGKAKISLSGDYVDFGENSIAFESKGESSQEVKVKNLETNSQSFVHVTEKSSIALDIYNSADIQGNIVADAGTVTDEVLQGANVCFNLGLLNTNNALLKSSKDLKWQGDVIATNKGNVNLNLGQGSYWAGRSDDFKDADSEEWRQEHGQEFGDVVSDLQSSGRVNVTMSDGAYWNVTGQSWVSKLDGNGTIDLRGSETGGYAIHIGEITGSNTFLVNLDKDNKSQSDMIYVYNGSGAAEQNIVISNRDEVLDSMDVGERVRFATVANASGGFISDGMTTEFSGQKSISTFGSNTQIRDAGVKNVNFKIVYEPYNTDKATAEEDLGYNGGESFNDTKPGNEYVESIYSEGENPYNVYIERLVQSEGNDDISDIGKTVVDLSRANYANAVYMDTLNKRQGEARFVGDTDHGVWVRLRHDNIGKEDAFRSHNTMVEVGIDQRDVHDYGEFHTGVALDYMNGNLDYHTVDGDGDIERYGIWFYTTYLGNDGQYADLILKYGHLKNDFGFNTKTQGEHVTGDYTNETASISAEYGWKFSNSHNYYIEPQAQLQYTYITGADYTTSQGSRVDLDSIHSLIGRVGFRAGKDFLDWEHPATFYLRADALHEFLGDQDIRAYDNTGVMDVTYENDDTWYTVGLGMTVKSSDNTYFFIEGETALGADNEDTYTVSGGFRHSF